jgi:hypothetical protein
MRKSAIDIRQRQSSMGWRKLCAVLAAITATGCDYDGLELCFGEPCSTGRSQPLPPELTVAGIASVDGYRVIPGEAVLEVYAPDDTLTPVGVPTLVGPGAPIERRTRVPLTYEGYRLYFGTSPDPAVCQYLARVVLWTGDRSLLQPLVPSPPTGCVPNVGPGTDTPGANFTLPTYLSSTEHRVWGQAYVGDSAASAGEVVVQLDVRPREGVNTVPTVTTVEDGSYELALDGPSWFSLCTRGLWGLVTPAETEEYTFIGSVPIESCSPERRLHDIRVGTLIAAQGQISEGTMPVGTGKGWVRILDPSDSAVVSDTVWTLDDGSYRIFFPHGLTDPGCGWLIEGGLTGGTSEIRPYWGLGNCDGSRAYHEFSFPPP